MTTQTLDLNNIEQKAFWILLCLIALATGFYLYSALSITILGVDRGQLSRGMEVLEAKTSTLEAEYLSRANEITLSYAGTLGFHEVNPKFTSGTNTKLSLAR